MNKTDAFFYRQTIARPFAKGDGTPLTIIGNESSSSYPINVLDGFAASYAATNGRFVTRGDMNAIGNLASQSQFYFQAGGLNTFDQAFAAAINGYPQDAVLDYLVGTRLYKVVSLRDNNMVDFTGAVATEDGITSGRVDGVNWAYANVDMPTVDRIVAADIPVQLAPEVATVVNSFIAPKNGMVFVDGTYDVTETTNVVQGNEGWFGAGLFIKAKPTSADIGVPTMESGYNGWTPFFAFTALSYKKNDTVHFISVSTFDVMAGNKYCIASTCGIVFQTLGGPALPSVTNLSMKVYIV